MITKKEFEKLKLLFTYIPSPACWNIHHTRKQKHEINEPCPAEVNITNKINEVIDIIAKLENSIDFEKKSKSKKFNYAVAQYWEKVKQASIGAYASHSSQIHFGTLKEAKNFLEYVKQKDPSKDWRIFEVIELK